MKCTSNTMEHTSQVSPHVQKLFTDPQLQMLTGLKVLSKPCLALKLVSMCSVESPLQFYVNHANSPSVTAYGPGLSYGIANKTATFTVFTEDAYEGVLAKHVAVECLA